MSNKDNNYQQNEQKDLRRGTGSGGGGVIERRSDNGYNNHTTEFERPSESKIDALFGKNKKKKK